LRCRADDEHFRVRRHIGKLARAVAGRCDDFAVLHDDRADGNFAARGGGLGLAERQLHEVRFAGRHLACACLA
jgi:hypothetical protein